MKYFKVGPLWETTEEAEIIGRLVLGYTELEISFWRLLAASVGDDVYATKMMFRSKNSENRLLVADATIRRTFSGTPHQERYSNMYGELDKCRRIRNEFAHAFWSRDSGTLEYVKLENAAQTNDGIIDAVRVPSALASLRDKEKIFLRTHAVLEELTELVQTGAISTAKVENFTPTAP